jgi:hypothetical protein
LPISSRTVQLLALTVTIAILLGVELLGFLYLGSKQSPVQPRAAWISGQHRATGRRNPSGGCHMAAFLLFVLAVAVGMVVADLVWENTTAAEVTVFGQLVTGYPLGWVLAMAATLGFVVALLLVASVGTTKGRRERRLQLRRLRRDRHQHPGEPEAQYTSALDQWFGRDGP